MQAIFNIWNESIQLNQFCLNLLNKLAFVPELPLPLMVLTDKVVKAVAGCWLIEGQGEVGLKELLLITFRLFSPSNNLVLSFVHSMGSTISNSVGGTWITLRLCSVFFWVIIAPFVLSFSILLFSLQQFQLPQDIRRQKFLQKMWYKMSSLIYSFNYDTKKMTFSKKLIKVVPMSIQYPSAASIHFPHLKATSV